MLWFKNGVLTATDVTTDSVLIAYFSSITGTQGTYQVQLPDSLCLVKSNSITITNESLPTPQITTSGDTLFSAQPCGNCQWLLNGQPIPGATTGTYIAPSTGTYSLEIQSDMGCKYRSADVHITISEAPMPPSVKKFSLSPNPTPRYNFDGKWNWKNRSGSPFP